MITGDLRQDATMPIDPTQRVLRLGELKQSELRQS